MRKSLLLGAAVLALAGCGGGEREGREESGAPPPPLEPLRLPSGPLPGRPVEGEFADEDGRPLTDVREVAGAGSGSRAVALLLARGRGSVPCVGVRIASARRVDFDCFEEWDRPPLFVRVALGGSNGRATDWLAVAGLVGEGVERLELQPQSGSDASVDLHGEAEYPWRAFAVLTGERNLANMLTARAPDGSLVAAVEVSWAYNPPCFPENDDICGDGPAPGPWAEVRDPIAAGSGADAQSALKIAFADPSVRRLAAGKTYFIGPTSGWLACSGRSLGAIALLRFHPPTSFAGEVPLREDARDEEPFAYREGRAYVEADGITAVEVWVDEARERVVGINVRGYDPVGLEEHPSAEIRELDELEAPKPAGGPDDPDACPEHDFGD